MAKRFSNTNPNARCFALVFACFLYGSAGYLSWVYNLTNLVPLQYIDTLTMVFGYACQALGIGAFALAVKRSVAVDSRPIGVAALALSLMCLAPALLGTSLAGVLTFGYLSNLAFGFLAGYYLHDLARDVRETSRGIVFGGAYGAATVAVWAISLPFGGSFLRMPQAILVYVALAALAVAVVLAKPAQKHADREAESHASPRAPMPDGLKRFIALAGLVVFLLSLVKNLGFSFPIADVESGLDLELSRVSYAVGLVIAGIVTDRSRKYGALLCLISLASPFIVLALSGEPISSMVFWCLGYFFFGFFSVFRVVLFSDVASNHGLWFVAGMGLLFGRLGDAAGTALCVGLAGNTLTLVLTTAVLFAISVVLFVLLFQQLFMPQPEPTLSEREAFERFCARHDLSAREREVLRLIIDEKTNSEIAATLFVSESTVKFHVRNLLKKTGCKNRLEVMAKYADAAH